jgi:hypothetical protein
MTAKVTVTDANIPLKSTELRLKKENMLIGYVRGFGNV